MTRNENKTTKVWVLPHVPREVKMVANKAARKHRMRVSEYVAYLVMTAAEHTKQQHTEKKEVKRSWWKRPFSSS